MVIHSKQVEMAERVYHHQYPDLLFFMQVVAVEQVMLTILLLEVMEVEGMEAGIVSLVMLLLLLEHQILEGAEEAQPEAHIP